MSSDVEYTKDQRELRQLLDAVLALCVLRCGFRLAHVLATRLGAAVLTGRPSCGTEALAQAARIGQPVPAPLGGAWLAGQLAKPQYKAVRSVFAAFEALDLADAFKPAEACQVG